MTDIEIAQKNVMVPVTEVAAKIGIGADKLELYGPYKAKLTFDELRALQEKAASKPGKLILVTAVTDTFLKAKPDMSQAHRVRTVMQNYYLYQKGAYYITEDNKIHVNIDKVVNATYSMLEKIIRIQLDDKFENAKKYIDDYFKWTPQMQVIADKLQELSAVLNCKVENKLADEFLYTDPNCFWDDYYSFIYEEIDNNENDE